MKKLILISILLVFVSSSVFAKTYKVEVDDSVVPYFEKAFEGEQITPSEWLGLQAVNLADSVINRAYTNKVVEGKSRKDKIKEIEK